MSLDKELHLRKKTRKPLSEDELLNRIAKIVLALDHSHFLDIPHGGLSSRNIFVDAKT